MSEYKMFDQDGERFDVKVIEVDPEWTVFAKCPVEPCKAVTHACCAEHLHDELLEHMEGEHYRRLVHPEDAP